MFRLGPVPRLQVKPWHQGDRQREGKGKNGNFPHCSIKQKYSIIYPGVVAIRHRSVEQSTLWCYLYRLSFSLFTKISVVLRLYGE
ncbi:hypothetical protein IQ218_00170 [Synechocystis salina LEGE 06099]|uniref:hypothetical protein n=1 Tax=Synechocystis salina TaxID=945780 RepID=UPI001881B501|nr:hypothetical protein [Synechocystis salina]MBE9202177.1 hypothetical protein [Synechocystis salina LEGE 06099]